jgi:hypothetical protein
MNLRKKFAALLERAEESVEYWRDVAITDFTRDLHARMVRMGVVRHEELAQRMGTSRPYITKLLDGGNFTLYTMVKVAMALGGVLRVHIADRDAATHWVDSYEPAASFVQVNFGGGQEPIDAVISHSNPSGASSTRVSAHG